MNYIFRTHLKTNIYLSILHNLNDSVISDSYNFKTLLVFNDTSLEGFCSDINEDSDIKVIKMEDDNVEFSGF